MQLFTFRIPEIEHFSLEKRKEILSRCAASPEMQHYHRKFQVIGAIAGILGFGLLLLCQFKWNLGLGFAAFIFTGVLTIFWIVLVGAKVVGEIRVVRKLIRIEMRGK